MSDTSLYRNREPLSPNAEVDDAPKSEIEGALTVEHRSAKHSRLADVEQFWKAPQRFFNTLFDKFSQRAAKPNLFRRRKAEFVAAFQKRHSKLQIALKVNNRDELLQKFW